MTDLRIYNKEELFEFYHHGKLIFLKFRKVSQGIDRINKVLNGNVKIVPTDYGTKPQLQQYLILLAILAMVHHYRDWSDIINFEPELIGHEKQYVEVITYYGEKRHFFIGSDGNYHLELIHPKAKTGKITAGAPYREIRFYKNPQILFYEIYNN